MNVLGFDLFLSRGLYGSRPALHLDAWRARPGHFFLVCGDWTLEVETPARLRGRAVVLAALVATGSAVPTFANADFGGAVDAFFDHLSHQEEMTP